MNKNPIRIVEGNAKPFEPFWKFRNAEEGEDGSAEIEFYGFISEYSWWDDDITPKIFKDDLNRIGKGGPVTIRINSGGGDMIAASVIRSILMDYEGEVTTRIDGLCASAATFVALAGNKVRMQDTGFFMVHDPSAFVYGTVEDLKGVIETLRTAKNAIIDAYQNKTGMEYERLSKLMSAETWMTAKEAREFGFVDEVIGQKQSSIAEKAAIVNSVRVAGDLSRYVNVPAALLANQVQAKAPDVENQQAAERLRAEIRLIL